MSRAAPDAVAAKLREMGMCPSDAMAVALRPDIAPERIAARQRNGDREPPKPRARVGRVGRPNSIPAAVLAELAGPLPYGRIQEIARASGIPAASLYTVRSRPTFAMAEARRRTRVRGAGRAEG